MSLKAPDMSEPTSRPLVTNLQWLLNGVVKERQHGDLTMLSLIVFGPYLFSISMPLVKTAIQYLMLFFKFQYAPSRKAIKVLWS